MTKGVVACLAERLVSTGEADVQRRRRGSLLDLGGGRVVLHLAQALVGSVPQLAIFGPGAVFDLSLLKLIDEEKKGEARKAAKRKAAETGPKSNVVNIKDALRKSRSRPEG